MGEGKLKKKKDPNAPKKPVGGAFGCFLAAHREEFQKACPGDKIAGVAKLAGEKWKKLADSEKEKYTKEYESKVATYQDAMKSYTPPPGGADEAAEPPAKRAKTTSVRAKAKGKPKAKVAPEE